MNLPDSFYIALCMTILLVGAVYWVWTQIQYVQRKVNVLENIVYELKTMCSHPPDIGPVDTSYPPAPPSVLGEDEDLLHETLSNEIYARIDDVQVPASPMRDVLYEESRESSRGQILIPMMEEVQDVPETSEKFIEKSNEESNGESNWESNEESVEESVEECVPNDLQPGGVGSGLNISSIQSSLDTMTLKELRRLAQQKGISGANDMKKKDVINAIRAVPIESFLT
jgi:hypothetical protein